MRFVALALSSLIFISCAGKSVGERAGTNGLPPGKDLERLSASAEQRQRASGSGSVSWKTEKRNIAASGILVLEWPRALRLEVQDPLGGMIAFLVLREGEFWSYMEDRGVATSGELGGPDANRVLPLPLSTEDYLRVLLAKPRLEGEEAEPGPSANSLIYRRAKREETLEWDPATDQPRRWRISTSGGRSYVEAQYSDYVSKAGVPFPGKIRIVLWENGRERLRLSWQWNELEAYIPKISDTFEIPPAWAKNVKTQRLRP